MPKCPNCGISIPFSAIFGKGHGAGIPCPRCAAIINADDAITWCVVALCLGLLVYSGFSILISLNVAWASDVSARISDSLIVVLLLGVAVLALFVPMFSALYWGPLRVAEMRPVCDHCGMVIPLKSPKFCPKCGEPVTAVGSRGKQDSVDSE